MNGIAIENNKELKIITIFNCNICIFFVFLGNTGISDTNKTLSDHLIMAVLALLKKEVPEHGRHIAQYFHLFLMYANLGPDEVSPGIIYLSLFNNKICIFRSIGNIYFYSIGRNIQHSPNYNLVHC